MGEDLTWILSSRFCEKYPKEFVFGIWENSEQKISVSEKSLWRMALQYRLWAKSKLNNDTSHYRWGRTSRLSEVKDQITSSELKNKKSSHSNPQINSR